MSTSPALLPSFSAKALCGKSKSKRKQPKIEEEIRGLFEKGLKLGADTLQLGHTLYRKHPHEWHRLQKNSALPLRPDMLESVNVQVHINDGGISKVKQKP
ncbi:Ger(x)C family spore germination C-terminal domain-containing protein [Brevibacillus agri]|uniref:Ger(x)C family spore germination C-terminal domain-containing protein n=1 Tax=Brevibacillus agri TaxID=51101 RepID=UPI0002A4E53C|nr:germination protein, Ger(x)C family [Brevibacillus agri BAB-2500]